METKMAVSLKWQFWVPVLWTGEVKESSEDGLTINFIRITLPLEKYLLAGDLEILINIGILYSLLF